MCLRSGEAAKMAGRYKHLECRSHVSPVYLPFGILSVTNLAKISPFSGAC